MIKERLLVLFLAICGWPLAGSGNEIVSFVISGGGGESSSDRVTLAGTIGQPIAGASAAGETAVTAGFWGGALEVRVEFDNAFEEWMANLAPEDQPPAGQRGPQDAPAGDGVENLLKFAFGLLPMEAAAGAAPKIIVADGDEVLGIEFTRGKDAEATFTVYGSNDLESWDEIPHATDSWDEPGLPEHRERVRLLTGLSAEENARYFLRLHVQSE